MELSVGLIIGSNTTIDRGSINSTIIGNNCIKELSNVFDKKKSTPKKTATKKSPAKKTVNKKSDA